MHGQNFPVNPPHGPNLQNVNPQQNANPPQQNNFFPQNNQFNANPQFQQFPNFNNLNMMMQPPMSPEQIQMQNELMKKQALHYGQTIKKQKEIMEQINLNRKIREQQRKTGEIVLFFIHDDDILPITFTADQMVVEALSEYIAKSGKNNVKFYFKKKELKINDTSGKALHELEGLRSGEEIKVVTA